MTPSLDPIALELCALNRTFRIPAGLFRPARTIQAVDDVSLRIYRGESLGLVGESGCGKSTLARMLMGLLTPTSGNVLINGREIDPAQRRAMARHVQPIFQDPYSSLNPRKTIEQIVGLPLHLHGVGTSAEQAVRIAEVLNLVGMPRRSRTQYPTQLSGGQRQRVAIARALILKPEILICDEPTSALDVSVQAQILNLLLDLKNNFNLTYFFISHNLGVVEHLVDRVAVMRQGRIVEIGSREQVFDSPQHPYTRMLLASEMSPAPGRGIPDIHIEDFDSPPALTSSHESSTATA